MSPLGRVELEIVPLSPAGEYFILRGLNEDGWRYIREVIPNLIEAQPPEPGPRAWPWYWVIKGLIVVPRASHAKLTALIRADFAAADARRAARAAASTNGTAR